MQGSTLGEAGVDVLKASLQSRGGLLGSLGNPALGLLEPGRSAGQPLALAVLVARSLPSVALPRVLPPVALQSTG